MGWLVDWLIKEDGIRASQRGKSFNSSTTQPINQSTKLHRLIQRKDLHKDLIVVKSF